MRRSFFLLLPTLLFLSSCSIYRSTVRKEFEDRSPTRLNNSATSSLLGQCESMAAFNAWIERELPGAAYEVLISEPDLEIWRRDLPDQSVEIRSFRISPSQSMACQTEFSSAAEWDASSASYLEELESLLNPTP